MKKPILLSIAFLFTSSLFANNIPKPKAAQYGFIENKGQIIDQNNQLNPSALYLYNGFGMNVQLRQTGFSYEAIKSPTANFIHRSSAKADSQQPTANSQQPTANSQQPEIPIYDSVQVHRIDISFLNGNKQASLISSEPAKDYINYYTTGTHVSDVPVEQAGVTNVHHYQKILYQNIYPNIDVEFLLNDKKQKGAFKYNFIIHPGGNINDIQLKFEGANTSLSNEGNIIIETAFGNIEESIPLSYQISENGSQQNITANFVQMATDIYGFNVTNFDAKATLVIDPSTWATYCGSGGSIYGRDVGSALATDINGYVYMTGQTSSTSGVATTGAYQTTYSVGASVIMVFNPWGFLVWGTYINGSAAGATANGIALDSNLNVYIIGTTMSTTGITTIGAFQTTSGGGRDAFLAKFSNSGAIQWATFYGGTNNDEGRGIATDRSLNVIFTGFTYSSNNISTSGAHQSGYGGGSYDAFIVKFGPMGNRIWGTYYGGVASDAGYGVATDTSGNILITGNTLSTSGIASTGAHQTVQAGSYDAFIVKFNSTGVRQWGTYIGGAGGDFGISITSDISGNIFVTGKTASTTGFATTGAFKTTLSGSEDAFITKFSGSGIRQWGTYYGGNGSESGNGIALDNSGNILIVGDANYYNSTGMATTGAYQTVFGGGTYDAFLAKFNSSGTTRYWGTYFGGSGEDEGMAVATTVIGNIFISGQTASTSGIATSGAYQTTYGGGYFDAYLAAFTFGGGLPVKLVSFDATPLKENETQKVDCRWSTASEINNNYFTIERSQDLENFEGIGNVKGAGNSSKLLHYQYRDEDPFTKAANSSSQPDKLYYRLRQTDFDGTSTLSEIKAVEFNNTANENIKLVYDKEQSLLQINSIATQKVSLQLFDLNGKQLWSGTENTREGLNTIPVQANVASGFYLLKVQLGDQVQNFKVWMK